MKKVSGKKEKKLTDVQQSAAIFLAEGYADNTIVGVLGISLGELRIWRNRDNEFIAELNYRRKVIWENSVDSLRSLVPQALTALQEVLNDQTNPQRWRAAMEIIKIVGLNPEAAHNLGRMIGSDDPREVERRLQQ